jgi:hypothetical protein
MTTPQRGRFLSRGTMEKALFDLLFKDYQKPPKKARDYHKVKS